MSDASLYPRIESLYKHILKIEASLRRHGSIEEALEDFEARDSLLMNLSQIGEQLNRIDTEKIPEEHYKGATGMRTFIVHQYDDIDYGKIIFSVEESLPDLKRILETEFKKITLDKQDQFKNELNITPGNSGIRI